MLKYVIHSNGTFDIASNDVPILQNAYPGIDGRSIYANQIELIGNNSFTIETKEGVLLYEFSQVSGSHIDIRITLSGYTVPIHSFHPFIDAEINDLSGIYQGAKGMGDPAGYINRSVIAEDKEILSYGVAGFGLPEGALVVYSPLQDKFENVYEIFTGRKSDGIYKGSGIDPQIFVTSAYQLEGCSKGETVIFDLCFEWSENLSSGLENAARTIGTAMEARLHRNPTFHWCSWYYAYHNFDMDQLKENLEGLKKMENPPEVEYIQIDAGYSTALGDWLEFNDRWPGGLEEAFALIREYGYKPGIWIGPFMVGNRSRVFTEHPDWVLYDLENRPLRPWINDNEPKPWGYQDEEYYILDTTHPEAMKYILNVFATFRNWGAVFFKTDFMLWGFQDTSRVKRYNPSGTSVEIFRDFLKEIRSVIGEESYWLGCIAPFIPFIGYADAMRIGGDVGSSWEGDFGPRNMIRSVLGNNYINHNFFHNDPDAVMLRDFFIRLTDTEVESLALLAAMSGGCIYTSDPLHRLSKERLELFNFIRPDKRKKPEIPYLEAEKKAKILVHRSDEKNGLLYLFNPSSEDILESYEWETLGFSSDVHLYDFQEGGWSTPGGEESTVFRIPSHGHRLFRIAENQNQFINHNSLWKNLR